MVEEVFILGSGFSKAAYKEMPLLNELTGKILKMIKEGDKIYYSVFKKYIKNHRLNNFEELITYLYQDFSWKPEEEYHLLKSLYFYINDLLVKLFNEIENKFKTDSQNKNYNLIKHFIKHLHYFRKNIITFNYDTFVEYFIINMLRLEPYSYEIDSNKYYEKIELIEDYLNQYSLLNDSLYDLYDEKNKILKLYYKDPDIRRKATVKKYFQKKIEELYPNESNKERDNIFAEVYSKHFYEELFNRKIKQEDIYQMPFSRIADRGLRTTNPDIYNETLRLLKLHGSINWYYSANKYGENKIYLQSGSKALKKSDTIGKKDLKPLVIPPLLDKSDFLEINSIRAIWRDAKNYLSSSKNIYIIGYSLPESDTTVRLMLKTSIKRNSNVYIINKPKNTKEEEKLKKRYLELLGGNTTIIFDYLGKDRNVVSNFIKDYLNDYRKNSQNYNR